MSILNFFKKRAADQERSMTQCLIVDGVSLASTGNGGAVRPPDQLQLLDRYGNFSRREKIPLTMLLVGKTLREIDEQGRYGDVRVVYAETREQLPESLRRILKSGNRRSTVVVTGSSDLAAVAGSMNVPVMQDKTLRKVVDRLQGDRNSGNARNSRSRNGNGGNSAKNQSSAGKPDKQGNQAKREPDPSSSAIDELIDRV